ncbi:MAG: iron uptake porin [Stenomitos rutilans HA7619-LM2]|jgi:hypothetical protein|nr:iron uptake porin [Stenomitos rutilans HA7619-LM2]
MNIRWNCFLVPTLLSAAVMTAAISKPARAAEASEVPGDVPMGQVTSVSQLSDVKPTDWAFQALQSLVERYGCIVGYPDKTYRGNRALTRYEFAAGLNACIDRINELIAAGTADFIKKEDLIAVQKMQEEFAAELATLRGRVDTLEARAATLEKQQFSTTTKLNAEVVFAIAGAFGSDRAITSDQQRRVDAGTPKSTFLGANPDVQDNPIFGDRVRLNFDTSFTGKDRLRARLQARNITSFSGAVTGTNMTRLGFEGNESNAINLSLLEYRFPLGKTTTIVIGGGQPDGIEYNDNVPILNPGFGPSGTGAISRFGRFSPVYRVATGSGIILNQKLGKAFNLSIGYVVPSAIASDPSNGAGLFNGTYTALAQLTFQPTPQFGIGFTYANSYYKNGTGLTGGTGSGFANAPFTASATTSVPTSADNFGIEASYRVSPRFVISGWGGYIHAKAKNSIGTGLTQTVSRGDEADIWHWAITLGFPDLGKKGNFAGIVFGSPPRTTSNNYGISAPTTVSPRRTDRDASYHAEGFFRFQLTENIAITPGVIVIFNPEGNNKNDTEYVGTIRTTFSF